MEASSRTTWSCRGVLRADHLAAGQVQREVPARVTLTNGASVSGNRAKPSNTKHFSCPAGQPKQVNSHLVPGHLVWIYFVPVVAIML